MNKLKNSTLFCSSHTFINLLSRKWEKVSTRIYYYYYKKKNSSFFSWKSVSRSLDDDGLVLQVVLEGGLSQLSADSGVLESSEGGVGIEDVVAVDVDGSGSQAVGQLLVELDALSDHSGSQSVLGLVGSSDHLIVVRELDDRHHGSEDLLLVDLHVLLHSGEHGGFNKESLVSPSLSSNHALGAISLSALNVVEDGLELDVIDLGALIHRVIEWVSQLDLLGGLDGFLHKGVVDLLVHEESASGNAAVLG